MVNSQTAHKRLTHQRTRGLETSPVSAIADLFGMMDSVPHGPPLNTGGESAVFSTETVNLHPKLSEHTHYDLFSLIKQGNRPFKNSFVVPRGPHGGSSAGKLEDTTNPTKIRKPSPYDSQTKKIPRHRKMHDRESFAASQITPGGMDPPHSHHNSNAFEDITTAMRVVQPLQRPQFTAMADAMSDYNITEDSHHIMHHGSTHSRSRSIPIKRSRHACEINENETTEAAEYDWATWRLYNRITSYREKYPVKYEPNQRVLQTSSSSSSNANVNRGDSDRRDGEIREESIASHHYGEMFELDL